MLTPTTFFVSIMLVITCFKVYDVVAIMTQGGPGRATKMLVTYIYNTAFVFTRLGYAAALSVLMVIISMIMVALFVKLIPTDDLS